MSGDPRAVAYELLSRVATEGAYANLLLPKLISEARLDGRDAAFATELSYGTLRWQGFLDAVIAKAAAREVERIDPQLRDLLRLGAYQLLFMRVPAHAAVDSTVNQVAATGKGSARGFVNAALRRVSERSVAEWQSLVTEAGSDELTKLSVGFSHPRWEVAALRDALGAARADLPKLLAVDNTAPRVTGVSRSGEAGVQELLASGGESGRWSPLAVTLRQDPANLPGVVQGKLAVQDEGSQLVVLAALNTQLAGRDEKWLDLCAGPGGKVALAASIRPAHVVAVEPQASRAELVRRSLSAVTQDFEVVVADGRDDQFATADFDRVFVDAPCTGLGVLRRRPESRWRRQPSDVANLAKLQGELLDSALRAVRPGGLVAYSTCSPHLAETEFVIEDALKRHPECELVDAVAAAMTIPGLHNAQEFAELAGTGPFLRLWPHLHDTDGMFLALLRRR